MRKEKKKTARAAVIFNMAIAALFAIATIKGENTMKKNFKTIISLIAGLSLFNICSVDAAASSIRGDVDGDNIISIADATIVLNEYARYAAGLNPIYALEADVDGDQNITLSDATEILSIYAKKAAGIEDASSETNKRTVFRITEADELIKEAFTNLNIEEDEIFSDRLGVFVEKTIIDYEIGFWDEDYFSTSSSLTRYGISLDKDSTPTVFITGTISRLYCHQTNSNSFTVLDIIEKEPFKFLIPITYDTETDDFTIENFKLIPTILDYGCYTYELPSEKIQEIFSNYLDSSTWDDWTNI